MEYKANGVGLGFLNFLSMLAPNKLMQLAFGFLLKS
jgi:hypothetical protein